MTLTLILLYFMLYFFFLDGIFIKRKEEKGSLKKSDIIIFSFFSLFYPIAIIVGIIKLIIGEEKIK